MTATATTSGGLSKPRLDRMHDILAGHVANGAVPGLVALVHRHGETHVDAVGTMAFGGDAPMRRDTIFRLDSLTKPITAAAAMVLVEECVLRLDEPVDRWLPELADRQVLRAIDAPLDDTVPANRPISLRDLLTFRLGLGAVMVFPPQYPIQHAMDEAGVAPGPENPVLPPDELMRRYGGLPLLHQPGEGWRYNIGSDILGVLIARASRQPLGVFLRERIFDPLGMPDTAFSVPPDGIDRLATSYRTDEETGAVEIFDNAKDGRFARPPVFESGAGGLVSTVDDYLAFCRLLLDKGRHGAKRILARPSVELMTTDHITAAQKAASPFFPGFWDSRGWGFGLSIVTRRHGLEDVPGRFGWDGGVGTSGYADPTEGLIGILMTQRLMDGPEPPPVYADFWTAAYAALAD